MNVRTRTLRTRVMATITLLVLALLVTGCFAASDSGVSDVSEWPPGQGVSGSVDMKAPDSVEMYGTDPMLAEERGVAGVPSSSDPMVIKTASARVRVDDIDEAITDLRAAASAVQGSITELSISSDEPVRPLAGTESSAPRYAFVTARVPADRLDEFIEAVRDVGSVLEQSEGSSDVTEQYLDLTARLSNLEAQEQRLREFFDRADNVEELLAIERELTRVRGEIEAMQAQVDYLERQSAMSTVTVQLETARPLVDPQGPFAGIRDAVANGIRAAIALIEGLIIVAIGALPLIVLVALAILVVRALVLRGRRRRAASAGESTAPGHDSMDR